MRHAWQASLILFSLALWQICDTLLLWLNLLKTPSGVFFIAKLPTDAFAVVKKGSRVSWSYQGTKTYGTVISSAGVRASIKGPSGGTITRVGSKDDPIIRIKSESTGNMVLKRRSQLKPAGAKK